MATNLLLTSAAQLLALINEENSTTLTESDVTFGLPSAHGGANPGDTDVVVSAAANSGYTGTVTVNYNRLDLAGFSIYGAAEVFVPEGATVADIVAAFNALYEANLGVDDYDEAASAPVPDDDGENFTLVADANSLAYSGQIVIVVRLATVALSSVITTTNLDGLEFPPA